MRCQRPTPLAVPQHSVAQHHPRAPDLVKRVVWRLQCTYGDTQRKQLCALQAAAHVQRLPQQAQALARTARQARELGSLGDCYRAVLREVQRRHLHMDGHRTLDMGP